MFRWGRVFHDTIRYMRILGIDYGSKRVGVAMSDEAGDFAYPYVVIENSKELVKKILEICKKEKVGKIVVGESLDFSGKPNPIMKKILRFADELEGVSGLGVFFEKEFYTSAQAKREQGEIEMLDASAAALILKSYLHRNKV